jgi:hypothetical protein
VQIYRSYLYYLDYLVLERFFPLFPFRGLFSSSSITVVLGVSLYISLSGASTPPFRELHLVRLARVGRSRGEVKGNPVLA